MTECHLCHRNVPDSAITKHHLEPKDKQSETVEICQPCHKQLHVIFTNHGLKHEYNTIEAITSNPEMEKFISWIQGTNKLDIQVSESEKVNRWRKKP